jgi:hypothetical protein
MLLTASAAIIPMNVRLVIMDTMWGMIFVVTNVTLPTVPFVHLPIYVSLVCLDIHLTVASVLPVSLITAILAIQRETFVKSAYQAILSRLVHAYHATSVAVLHVV